MYHEKSASSETETPTSAKQIAVKDDGDTRSHETEAEKALLENSCGQFGRCTENYSEVGHSREQKPT